jgi:hypothetical protein
MRHEHQLPVSAKGFRIMAPEAPQWATFHEQGRACSGPVVDREALDIEYSTGEISFVDHDK